jgi:hypothetical protein
LSFVIRVAERRTGASMMVLLKFERMSSGSIFINEDAIIAVESAGDKETQIFTTGQHFIVSVNVDKVLEMLLPRFKYSE